MITPLFEQLNNLILQKKIEVVQKQNIKLIQKYLKPELELARLIKKHLLENDIEYKYKTNLILLLMIEFGKERETQDIHKLISIFSKEIQILKNLKEQELENEHNQFIESAINKDEIDLTKVEHIDKEFEDTFLFSNKTITLTVFSKT